ncbi:MAG: saccharopine dehydrogenase NADP-binding domain-containing protein [Desulfobacterales bacterium]|nr:saccharopine dehydrogenase NADP-binding domain-containing protein [Desulfobacterales bacterium]
MKKVTVLGGCGAVGSIAVKALANHDLFSNVVVADIDIDRAKSLTDNIKSNKMSSEYVNAEDIKSVKQVIKGSDIVLNCVGPFYKSVKTILNAVIEEKIDYVDVCDDVDVTLEILDWDQKAKDANITALIGMGSSPGATNLLAKYAADALLDTTESIDIFHAHGGEPIEGAGVIGHRFHCMTIDIPMYLNGKIEYVKYFEPDGIALRQTFDFPVLGNNIILYPYPHPEQITLPKYIKTNQVTNKGTVIPSEYYDLTRDICKLGFYDKNPLDVKGQKIVPYDFAIAFILRERDRILKETNFGQQRGCCSVVVKGIKNDAKQEYRFHMASRSQALGEGTGIPAAAGTILMALGKINKKGVFPPEGCVDPLEFMGVIPQIMKLDSSKTDGQSFGGILVQHIDVNGKMTEMNLGI